MSAVTPTFRGFDPYTPMDIYQRHLPHWRQPGATYFVTLRLGDSIPRQVLLRWIDEDTMWLKAHGIDGALTEPRWRAVFNALPQSERILFEKVAGRRLHLELDRCHGSCLLRLYEARKAVVEAFNHFHGRRWWVGDFIVMPNHVHGLFQSLTASEGAEHLFFSPSHFKTFLKITI